MFSLFRVAHAIYVFTNCCNHQVKLFFFQWYQYIVNAKKKCLFTEETHRKF